MKRFLLLWVALTLVLGIVTVLTSWLVFHHLDVRSAAFFQLLVIPAFQAAVLLWVARRWELSRFLGAVRATWRHPLVASFLLADLAFLAIGLVHRTDRLLGLAGEASLQPFWLALKAALAAALFAALASRRGLAAAERVCLFFFAALVAALGMAVVTPWPSALPGVLSTRMPLVLRWLVAYGSMAVVTMAALLRAGEVLHRRRALAGGFLEGAALLAFLVMLVVALSTYSRPYLVQPWASVVPAGLSLVASLLLAGALLALAPPAAAREP